MTTETAGAIFRELDVIRSINESLQHMLENNAGIRDYHGLATLAGESVRKVDFIVDMLDRGGVTA